MLYAILIHGTFARGAAWTMSGSPLELAVARALGRDATVTRHEWSGKNSFGARADAAVALRAMMCEIVEKDREAEIFLVAHSHGGNVALQALRDGVVTDHLGGLVCLATPVFHATKTESESPEHVVPGFLLVLAALVGSSTVGAATANLALGNLFDLRIDQRFVWWAFFGFVTIALLAIVAASVFVVAGAISTRIARKAHAIRDLLLDAACPPELKPEQALFVRHSGDEALAFAGGVHMASWTIGVTSKALAWIARAVDYAFEHWVASLGSLVALTASTFLLGSWFGADVGKSTPFIYLGTVIAIAGATLSVAAIAATLRWLAVIAQAVFFGPEIIFAAGTVRVTVEATPRGEWSVLIPNGVPMNMRREAEVVDEPFPYAHGRVYGDPIYVAATADWIARSVRERADGRPTKRTV